MDMYDQNLLLTASQCKVAAVSADWSLGLTARHGMITKFVATRKVFTCQDERNCQRLAK
jgi:hypothetical protein